MTTKTLSPSDVDHILFLAGYHVACIMTQDSPISCSPHRDMRVFEHELTAHNRIRVRNLYMAEVAKLISPEAGQ